MGKPGSVFLFFALSTVALIVMQPGPRSENLFPVASSFDASRNDYSALRPQVADIPLPVPDDVIADIKRAAKELPAPQVDTALPDANAPQVAAIVTPEMPNVPAVAQPQPVFDAQVPQTAVVAAQRVAPVSSELRDMSWSALGTLQQLGQKGHAPGGEGSLINSIVRRSMAHVEGPLPVRQPAVQVQAFQKQPSEPVQPQTPNMDARKTYKVVSGDNLALIAIKLYGSALQTDKLLLDNPALKANPSALRIGQIISYRTY
ncbi:MAG: hypothetical protein AAF891_07985 [Pseudomonadota bacterium]